MRQLDTPVVLIIFNRPEPTRQVVEVLRQVTPRTLLVIADGPRADMPSDATLCAETRTVIGSVDWDCDVVKQYSDVNLGCGRRVSSGLDWVFDQHKSSIILEDDCVPDPSFFPFCAELLDRYQDDERIMQVCGHNPLRDGNHAGDSYFYSLVGSNWGWATWRRAWHYFDFTMQQWPEPYAQKAVRNYLADDDLYRRRAKINWATYTGKVDTWDFQWSFARMMQSGLSIMPFTNLVRNVGFGEDSTHYVNSESPLAHSGVQPMAFPLQHPIAVVPDRAFDKRIDKLKHALSPRDYVRIAKYKLRQLVKN